MAKARRQWRRWWASEGGVALTVQIDVRRHCRSSIAKTALGAGGPKFGWCPAIRPRSTVSSPCQSRRIAYPHPHSIRTFARHGFTLDKGATIWEYATGAAIAGSPAFAGGRLCADARRRPEKK